VVVVAPSILSADFAALGAAIALVEPHTDILHVDVMDGHFVPNLTIGPPVVASLRRVTACQLDCHLMVTDPASMLDDFARAGANGCTIHVEVGSTVQLLERIGALGMRRGLSLNPATPIESVEPFLGHIDLLLVMSVVPGFGGQVFMPEVLPKIAWARDQIDRNGFAVQIEVDGGINMSTAPDVVRAGADILVAGNAVFKAEDPAAAVLELQSVI